MSRRLLLGLVCVLTTTFPAVAQVGGSTRAAPPDRSALERLNLKTEWTVNLPVSSRKDGITHVQTFGDQIFVQTRGGLLSVIDMSAGRIQWTVQLGNGIQSATYPLAVNSLFVYVSYGTKLYAFHRFTGVGEFVTDMGSSPTTGLSADESGVYCVLEARGVGANRVVAYNLPRPIPIAAGAQPVRDAIGKPIDKDKKSVNPVDELASRYTQPQNGRSKSNDTFTPSLNAQGTGAPVVGVTGSGSPSLQCMPRITPPYSLRNDTDSPSVNVLNSLRQPYQLKNDFQRDIQQTPSLGTLMPSQVAGMMDLRAKPIEPHVRWEYGVTSRVEFPIAITPVRAWLLTDGRRLIALNKVDKKIEANDVLLDSITAPAGRAGLDMYIPLGAGYLWAIEGTMGQLGGGAHVLWRATTGIMGTRTPFVTDAMVYVQGDGSGVACVDRKKGEVLWRSESTADRILACNKEFIYIRNHQGRLMVYDANRATDRATKRSMPLAHLELAEFNFPVTNTVNDRLLLAADSGLIVCLRDMSPKYRRPVNICPETIVNPKPVPAVTVEGKDQPPKDPGAKDPGAKDPGAKDPGKEMPKKD